MKRALFNNRLLPWLLLAPQLIITVVFFLWPAGQAVWQSFLREDAFGLRSEFVGLLNYKQLWSSPEYLNSFWVTAVFTISVTLLTMGFALLMAVAVDRLIRGDKVYTTLLVWPYAIAPAVAGILWWFIFNPSIGILTYVLAQLGIQFNYVSDPTDAMILVVLASSWSRISYSFLFFLAGLQSIPNAVIEAATIDGASPWRRFWTIVFPLLSPTTFFLLVMNVIYAFFDTFAIVDAATHGGPGKDTAILVYRVYYDGFKALDMGGSAAQSVVLMAIVIVLTVFQFRFVEKKVQY